MVSTSARTLDIPKITKRPVDEPAFLLYNKKKDRATRGRKGRAMIESYIVDTDGDIQLGQHFKVKEFACKDGSPVVFIDDYLYTILNILRNKIRKPVIITSGYRTPTRNKEANGAKYSYHMRGQAADIQVNGMKPKEVANELNKIVPDECGIIVYDRWVHIDTRNKKYRKGV